MTFNPQAAQLVGPWRSPSRSRSLASRSNASGRSPAVSVESVHTEITSISDSPSHARSQASTAGSLGSGLSARLSTRWASGLQRLEAIVRARGGGFGRTRRQSSGFI